MKMIRRLIAAFLMVVLLMGCIAVSAFADDVIVEDSGTMNLDVVFVIDDSWSMDRSDEHHISEEAAELFADMCDADNCRFGYVIYTQNIEAEQTLVNLNDSAAVQRFKNQLREMSGKERPTTSYTDIPMALTEAKNILKNAGGGSNRNSLIVLLSDGGTYLEENGRTLEEAERELKATLQELSDSEIPVYTIGLNDREKWKAYYSDAEIDQAVEDVKAYMMDISNATGGRSYFPESANELPEINNEIFADFNKIIVQHPPVEWDGEDYVVTIPIENSSVCMANIVVLNNATVSNPRLYTPGGTAISMDDSAVQVVNSDHYMLVKLLFPEKGDWTLRLKGYEGDKPQVSLLCAYTLTAIQECDSLIYEAGSTGTVRTMLFDGDNPITDSTLIGQLTASCSVDNLTTGDALSYEMTYDSASGWFTCNVPFEKAGNYRIESTISAADSSFYKTSGKESVTVTEPGVEPGKGNLSKITVWKWFSKDINISDLTDSSIAACSATEGGTAYADIDRTGLTLHVSGKKAGHDTFTVYGETADGMPIVLTGVLRVYNTLVLIVLVLIAVLAIIGLLIWRWSWRLHGGFYDVYFSVEGDNKRLAEISIPRKRVITVNDIANSFLEELNDIAWETNVRTAVKQYSKELKATKLKVRRNGTSFVWNGRVYQYIDERISISWESKDGELMIDLSYE